MNHPVTPHGRYFVVRGRLWRMANPALGAAERSELVHGLMAACRAVRGAKQKNDLTSEATAHKAVDKAKHALGERGLVWWTDGTPDLDRHIVKKTPYAVCYATIGRSRPGGS